MKDNKKEIIPHAIEAERIEAQAEQAIKKSIRQRRLLSTPMISPLLSSETFTARLPIGSRRTGLTCLRDTMPTINA